MTHEHDEDPERRRRLDQVLGAYLEAVDAGQSPDPREWLTRHPDLDPELSEFFADEDRFGAWIEPLRSAARAAAECSEAATLAPSETTAPPPESPATAADPYATASLPPREHAARLPGPGDDPYATATRTRSRGDGDNRSDTTRV
jgi:hypothetical protein